MRKTLPRIREMVSTLRHKLKWRICHSYVLVWWSDEFPSHC